MTYPRDQLRAQILDVLRQAEPIRADDMTRAGVPRRFAAAAARDGRQATTARERHAVATEWADTVAADQDLPTQHLIDNI